MSLDGSLFINPLTMCDVEVEFTNEQHETIKQTVRLGYYRARFTKSMMESIEACMKEETLKNMASLDDLKPIFLPIFLKVVGWWNVKRGEEMWPLTAEAIEPMDAYYISRLVIGIIGSGPGMFAGEAAGEDSPESKKSMPLSATSAQEAPTTASPEGSSPPNMTILPSRKASKASRRGNGNTRRLTTTKARSSGMRSKSG